MRANRIPFINFNQMLVISVFVHFAFLTLMMFMPKTQLMKQKIKPAFMVDLIEIPKSPSQVTKPQPVVEKKLPQKEQSPPIEKSMVPNKPKKIAKPKPVPVQKKVAEKPKMEAIKEPQPEPLPELKPIVPPKPIVTPLMEAPKPFDYQLKPAPELKTSEFKRKEIEQFQPAQIPTQQEITAKPSLQSEVKNQPVANPLLKKLDQMAKIEPQVAKSKPVPAKPTRDPLLDQTFQELNEIRPVPNTNQKKSKLVVPVPSHDPFEDFENIKMKKDIQKVAPKQNQIVAAAPKNPQEQAFEELTQKKIKLDSVKTQQLPQSIQKELETLKNLKSKPVVVAKLDKRTKTRPKPSSRKSLAPILNKKLDSLKKKSIEVSVEINTSKSASTKTPADLVYKSKIRSIEAPDLKTKVEVETPGTSFKKVKPMGTSQMAPKGKPSSTVINHYAAMVKSRVQEHWKDPIGGGKGVILVSFYVFPEGNIDSPVIIQESNDFHLDNLAIRAIQDSAPFPVFPDDLRIPNMRLTLEFNYE